MLEPAVFMEPFINTDPAIAELKQMVTDSATSTFSAKKWKKLTNIQKKAMRIQEKDELMSSGNEFAVTGVR